MGRADSCQRQLPRTGQRFPRRRTHHDPHRRRPLDGRSRNRSSGLAELLLPADVRRRQPAGAHRMGLATHHSAAGRAAVGRRPVARPSGRRPVLLLAAARRRQPASDTPPQRHGGQPHPDHRGSNHRSVAAPGHIGQSAAARPVESRIRPAARRLIVSAMARHARPHGRAGTQCRVQDHIHRARCIRRMARGRQSPLARRPRQRQLQPDRRAFPLHRPDAALESIGHRRAGIFPAFARRLRHRRLLRPDATGRLGRRHRTEHHTDTPGQRHHKGV